MCVAHLNFRDKQHTTVATDDWTVNGSKVRLDVPAAIPRFLAADKLHTCTTKYFAVLRQARGGKLTASVEQTDLQRALQPCAGTAG